ncbi:9381_t:CDS:2, partial [Funneliformis geosporum]
MSAAIVDIFDILDIHCKTEEFYPKISELYYTLPSKKYPIPDNLSIKTTWGRRNNQQTVQ